MIYIAQMGIPKRRIQQATKQPPLEFEYFITIPTTHFAHCNMSTASPQDISSTTMVTKTVDTIFFIIRRGSHHLPTALSRPNHEIVIMAACFSIAMLIVIAFLALKIHELRARARRWELAGGDHDELHGDGTMYGNEKKAVMRDVVGLVPAREIQVGGIVSVDDTALMTRETNVLSVEEGNRLSGIV
ncbi:hypothetical protein ARMGADRAFT_1087628 [Armillaria gallica]|uniref:Uncharacterized protein n=1 Tax=Armillaria gallica TaxID=47427 RepID=A0A2H3DA85_ARMGA|nr:hypothetical protein ARMGADRAFT_1087628 [Armillaria gallica]